MESTAQISRPPSSRRDGIDVARCLALFIVVFGHLTLAVVDRRGGVLRGANLLALRPTWAWIGVAAPMPIFFGAAGWANATATSSSAAVRLRTLVGLAGAVVAAWSGAVVLSCIVSGGPGALGAGARLATQPLWFLAAYLPLAAASEPLGRLSARRPVAAIGGCITALALLDVVRFELHGPSAIGWAEFLLAWSVPWIAGAGWRARHTAGRFAERRVGLALLVGCSALGAALVAFGGYQPSLIDAVPGGRSNSSPPTLYTAIIGLAQVGALMVGARALDQLGRRAPWVWDRLGAASVGIYVWHLTALALGAGLIALGLPAPERLSGSWWVTRPLWFGLILGLAAALVSITARTRSRLAARSARTPGPAQHPSLGIAIASVAAAITGLVGPTRLVTAAVCSALFGAAWWMLREAPAPRAGVISGRRGYEERHGIQPSAAVPVPAG